MERERKAVHLDRYSTADEILAKVRVVEANIKKLVDNNAM
jgi:hypothetical protein